MKSYKLPNKSISPFFVVKRVPKKLKKKVKKVVGVYWNYNEKGNCLWYYLRKTNINYSKFIMNQS